MKGHTLGFCSLNQKLGNFVSLRFHSESQRANKQHHSKAQQLSNELSHFRVLSIESKVRKLCITQGFTLGVKALNFVIEMASQIAYSEQDSAAGY